MSTTTDAPHSAEFMDRFWSKVSRRGPDECWLWTGSTDARGYGKIFSAPRSVGRQLLAAHRASIEIDRGARIPDGLCALHTCRSTGCVNPAHLYVGTRSDNTRDQIYDGTHKEARKTHCKNGHPFDAHYARQRVCTRCKNEWQRQCYRRRMDARKVRT